MPPTGLKGAALNRVRANARALLQDTCDIKGMAGSPRTFQVLASSVPCRFWQDDYGQAAVDAVYTNPVPTYLFELPWNQAVAEENQIVHNGRSYEVLSIDDDATPLIVKRARVRRVKTAS